MVKSQRRKKIVWMRKGSLLCITSFSAVICDRKHAEAVEDLCDSDSDKEVKHERYASRFVVVFDCFCSKRFRSLKDKTSELTAPPSLPIAPPASHASPMSVEASSSLSYTEPAVVEEDMVIAAPSPAAKKHRRVTEPPPKSDPNLKEVR